MLGLCRRRLSIDWQARWGRPVLVVERFVAETHYRGTACRAVGFTPLGATGGFARSARDCYQHHGAPQQWYLRELRPGARRRLRPARLPAALAAHEARVTGPCPFRGPALETLLDRLATLPDARRGRRHRQRFVLAGAALAALRGSVGYRAGENQARKVTQRQLRARGAPRSRETGRYRPPSDSSFRRLLQAVDPDRGARISGAWWREQAPGTGARLALDGQVLRGSGRHDGPALQFCPALTHQLRLTLDQLASAKKTNEIPALLDAPLLRDEPAGRGNHRSGPVGDHPRPLVSD